MELLLEAGDAGVGPVAGGGVGADADPALGEARGKDCAEGGEGGVPVALGALGEEWGEDVDAGGEIEAEFAAGVPVGRDLQDGGAAEAAVGDEEFFAEFGDWLFGFDDGCADDFGGESGEVAPLFAVGGAEDQRHKCGARLDEVVAELSGEIVAEAGGAHFWDGEAAGGDDEGGCDEVARRGFEVEATGGFRCFGPTADGCDLDAAAGVDLGFAGLFFEHGDDLLRGAVAEELAESFFVILNAVLFDEGDEVLWREASKRGFGEVRVGAEEVFGFGADVGEVAAAAAGDEDLFAGAVGVVEEEDAAASFAGFDGGHQAGGACAEDHYVKLHAHVLIVVVVRGGRSGCGYMDVLTLKCI